MLLISTLDSSIAFILAGLAQMSMHSGADSVVEDLSRVADAIKIMYGQHYIIEEDLLDASLLSDTCIDRLDPGYSSMFF